jgi:hypothetical protein
MNRIAQSLAASDGSDATLRLELEEAIQSVKPGDPGDAYVAACSFVALWIIGTVLDARNSIYRHDPAAKVDGTPQNNAMVETLNELANTELTNKVAQLSKVQKVRQGAWDFWCTKLETADEDDCIDKLAVDAMIYDGAVVKLKVLGQDADQVEKAKEIFQIVTRSCEGHA